MYVLLRYVINILMILAMIQRAPKFVAIDKQIPARRDFTWQNKFVSHTTDTLIDGLASMWHQFRVNGEHKKDRILFHIGGGPGVGKTRFGVELLTSLCESIKHGSYVLDPSLVKAIGEAENNRHYVYINLSTIEGKQAIRDASPSKVLLSKLLKMDVAAIPFDIEPENLALAIYHVFRPATREDPLFIQVHIDEIQFALQDEDVTLLQTTTDIHKVRLRQFLTQFMELVVHLTQHNVFLFTVTSGAIQFALIRKTDIHLFRAN